MKKYFSFYIFLENYFSSNFPISHIKYFDGLLGITFVSITNIVSIFCIYILVFEVEASVIQNIPRYYYFLSLPLILAFHCLLLFTNLFGGKRFIDNCLSVNRKKNIYFFLYLVFSFLIMIMLIWITYYNVYGTIDKVVMYGCVQNGAWS